MIQILKKYLPYWLYEKTILLLPKKLEKTNVQIMNNSESNNSIIQSNFISSIIRSFIYIYQLLNMILITIYFFITQKCMPERKNDILINDTTLQVENLNNIMQSLKMYASKAEKEHDYISSHFKKIKSQIENQEETLGKNTEEINNLMEKLKKADKESIEQKKIIESMEKLLENTKKELLNAEKKLIFITKQLKSSVTVDIVRELERYGESDKDYNFIICSIEEMKVKMQQQENRLANTLQLVKKLDKLHDVNRTIDKQKNSFINLKNGLSQESSNIFDNLKNILGNFSESTFIDGAESEDIPELDDSLNIIEQHTKSFLDKINVTFKLPNCESLHENQNCALHLNKSIEAVRHNIADQSVSTVKDIKSLEKEIQVSINVESKDVSCQTIETSGTKNSLLKETDTKKLQKELSAKTAELENYKLKVEESLSNKDKKIIELENDLKVIKQSNVSMIENIHFLNDNLLSKEKYISHLESKYKRGIQYLEEKMINTYKMYENDLHNILKQKNERTASYKTTDNINRTIEIKKKSEQAVSKVSMYSVQKYKVTESQENKQYRSTNSKENMTNDHLLNSTLHPTKLSYLHRNITYRR